MRSSASMLAAHGYPTLALAYFTEPGLPATVSRIPLEYFVKALKLLAAQPGVDRNKVMVVGVSRGSEAALLLGARFPGLVHGVIAGSPTAVVFPDYPAAGHDVGSMAAYFSSTDDGGGGTVDANAQASARAHVALLTFLGNQ